MEYLIFKIVVLLGIGAAMDRAFVASRILWANRLGHPKLPEDVTEFETSPQCATLKETGEQVVVLQLLTDSDYSGVECDGKVNESELIFPNNLNEN